MLQKTIYGIALISYSIYLKYTGRTETEIILNIIIMILLFILFKLLDNKKND